MADSFSDVYSMPYLGEPEDLRPTRRQWLRHGFLFLLTLFTTTIAGLMPPLGSGITLPDIPVPTNAFEWLLVVQHFYALVFASVFLQVGKDPAILIEAFKFSLSLMAILTAHEFGHYIACRIYGVKASLPFFIPTPPLIGPAGTLGAVIKIQAPMPTQRAIFDIGVAGPLAGFAVIVPVAIIGLLTMQMAPPGGVPEMTFADPLLTRLLGAFIGVDPTNGIINPFYSAAWIGSLVTALNLLPAGQLDGGHAVYSVLGERAHFVIGRLAFVGMVILTVLGWQLYNSPSGVIFTILLGVLLRFPHPPPLFDEPLDRKRMAIAVLTLIVFVLSFTPFPVQLH
jgi:membrane-associated protease RseP (regulator of RpoE activity)